MENEQRPVTLGRLAPAPVPNIAQVANRIDELERQIKALRDARSNASERNLVAAVLAVQHRTGDPRPARSLVASQMICAGAKDPNFKFRTICRSAERLGWVELGVDEYGPEWIALGPRAALAM